MKTPLFFIFAGETSADLYGKSILETISKSHPEWEFFGVGGPLMEETGFSSMLSFSDFQRMGFTDVVLHLTKTLYNMQKISKEIIKKQPSIVLLIDQPSFTIRLAEKIRRQGYTGKIVQFVAPSVWAYNPSRADKMAKSFDLLLTLFSFELSFFSHTSLKTVWVGHPMIALCEQLDAHTIWDKTKLDQHRPILAIFPGSRPKEIERNIEQQIAAAQSLESKFLIQIAIVAANQATYEKLYAQYGSRFHIVPFENRHLLMKETTLALAKSGSVLLELAYYKIPTVVVYKISTLNVWFAKYILKVKIPYFSLVNIIAKKELFTELIYPQPTTEAIINALECAYSDQQQRVTCKLGCEKVIETLKRPEPAAFYIEQELDMLLRNHNVS